MSSENDAGYVRGRVHLMVSKAIPPGHDRGRAGATARSGLPETYKVSLT